ncbi:head decoration protein [Bradyrhizobium barranii subsp. barranii]|uniref:Head decoration protein n=1 Tax=Bradyrhizobium barranii subsp. barranii TaxID=2823807 RepID=A0A939MFI2_9BRAD|nr:head decoration protein [Bradyrhizobium barranii]UEM11731.1 head decoration protein [Bradyrhizobium barranii subsp. barranii]
MPTFNEGRHPAEFLLSEANGQRSRGNITIGQNQTIVPGSVLGQITASGQYIAHDPAAADGSQTAAAVALYGAVTGAGATAAISAIVREAELNGKTLTTKTGLTAPQLAQISTDLAGKQIIVR